MTRRVLGLAALQIGFLLSWAGYHEYVWATAPTFRIPLQPRDPYDLLRGRYFVLNPQDRWLTPPEPLSSEEIRRFRGHFGYFSGKAAVGFCRSGDVYRVCRLRHLDEPEPQDGLVEFWARGQVTVLDDHTRTDNQARGTAQVDLGLSRFFIPNRTALPASENVPGWELELSHRPGLEPLPRRLFFKGTPLDLR